jgi:hypothetical protein
MTGRPSARQPERYKASCGRSGCSRLVLGTIVNLDGEHLVHIGDFQGRAVIHEVEALMGLVPVNAANRPAPVSRTRW